jgi:hypothetical protein
VRCQTRIDVQKWNAWGVWEGGADARVWVKRTQGWSILFSSHSTTPYQHTTSPPLGRHRT